MWACQNEKYSRFTLALVFFLTGLLWIPSGRADEDCQDVDLSSALPKPLDRGADNDWCFAFTAATLLKPYLGDVSASDIAMAYYDPQFNDDRTSMLGSRQSGYVTRKGFEGGGFSDVAIKLVDKTGGFCDESALGSDIKEHVEIASRDDHPSLEEYSNGKWTKSKRGKINCKVPASLSKDTSTGCIVQAKDIWKIRNTHCKKRKKLPANVKVCTLSSRYRRDAPKNAAKFLAAVEGNLNKAGLTAISVNRGPSNHTMVVAGRRKNPQTGQCEFRIRDSAGPKCDHGNPVEKPSAKCENGDIFLTREQVAKQIEGATFLTEDSCPTLDSEPTNAGSGKPGKQSPSRIDI